MRYLVVLTAHIIALLAAIPFYVLHAEPVEHTVQFSGANGVVLLGTLTSPQDATPRGDLPALLLLQGSGPTDRNGNQPPLLMPNVLRELAIMLADQGIVTLRYDKRGLHANARDNMGVIALDPGAALREGWSAWENFTGDARAALAFLRSQPIVNPSRTGIFGHSEGGLVALDLAAESDETVKPRVLILAGTPGRRVAEVIEEQLAVSLREVGASEATKRYYLASVKRVQAEIAITGQVPSNVPHEVAQLFPRYIGRYMRSLLALDPAQLARVVHRPTLVINGADDRQISAERDAAAFTRVLADRRDGSEVFIPHGVSHNLKPANRDFQGITGNIDAQVADELLSWLRLHL